MTQVSALVHGQETDVFADAGYQGVAKREDTQSIEVSCHVAKHPDKRRTLDKATSMGAMLDKLEQVKSRIRTKVEHPFRVIKRRSVQPRCATADWPRTRRSCSRCLRSPICGLVRHSLLSEARGRVRLLLPNGPTARGASACERPHVEFH